MMSIKRNAEHLGQDICKGEKMTELEPNKKELELDDLLISGSDEGEEAKSNSNKKIVLLSAIGVLLFAIVILVVYILQSDTQEREAQMQVQKPLERIEQQTLTQNTQNTPTYFGQEPITESANEQFQRIIEQMKAEQAKQGTQNLPSAPESKPDLRAAQPAAPIPPQAQAPQVQVQAQAPQAQKVESPQQTPMDIFKEVQTSGTSLQGSEATKGFYVQVASFSRLSPNQQLLSLITSENFSYRMQKAGENNRLLIGPFASRQEAQNKLAEIREKINKSAFINEVK